MAGAGGNGFARCLIFRQVDRSFGTARPILATGAARLPCPVEVGRKLRFCNGMSSKPMSVVAAHVYELVGGKVRRFLMYADTAPMHDALR